MNPSDEKNHRPKPRPLVERADAHEIARRQAEEEERRGRMSRRDFVSQCGACLAGVVVAAVGASAARVIKPDVLPEPSLSFKVGSPSEFTSGEATLLPDNQVAIFRDGEEFWSLTQVCTHLGCIVAVGPDGFHCPCHGSHFSMDGRVLGGPAPRPLQWWKLSLSPDCQLVVHADQEVPVGTKFKFET
ncbi:MAG: ubiquinol-cytochrome c reductase iron-sulfur subunit [Armatimonadetes bacterium]|nr:ubiquinol-cytochrome c reductase iron-sulfur subunit [Armatimonadota bacterium]